MIDRAGEWGIFTAMSILPLVSLLVFTVGLFSYGAIFIFWLSEFGKAGWAGQQITGCGARRSFDLVGGAIVFVSFAWFAVNLLLLLASLDPRIRPWPFQVALHLLVFLFPPLIMHTTFVEARDGGGAPLKRGWKVGIWGTYLVSQFISLFTLLGYSRVVSLPHEVLDLVTNVSIAALFIIAGIYSSWIVQRARSKAESTEQRASRRLMIVLIALVGILCLPMILADVGWMRFPDILRVVLPSLPLAFLFVGTYFRNRFAFFDLFIKRGLYLLLTIVLLTAFFGLVLPRLDRFNLSWARPWVEAVALLPVAASLPWLLRRLGAVLDRLWLGRRYTTVAAVKYFLSALQSATSERQLVERAETGIAAIFRARVRIDLGPRDTGTPGFDAALEIPIRSHRDPVGVIRLGERARRMPFFSEDEALAGSLADVFSYMLENMRLQEKKQEQEQLVKEQALHASRSELKALRAQINPHFLFNALNAIAGLIVKDPARADKTVEQLAEVFRYTLRRSESEWAPLEEEMEFARAYLEVEQARFGSRLQFRVSMEDAVRAARIPTMMLQTLVENAVKHGVSVIRGVARIEIDAGRRGDRLRVEVADNGPGFQEGEAKSSGYGLRNIRERLRGYFGKEAGLAVQRDDPRQMTLVSLTLPLPAGATVAAGERLEQPAAPGRTPAR